MYRGDLEMMRILCVLFAAAVVAASASAGHHEEAEKAGGKAAEHMSDQAKEKANAQWKEGSTRGAEKQAEVDGMKKALKEADQMKKGKAKAGQ
jgi:Flp pilus assembly protein TadB